MFAWLRTKEAATPADEDGLGPAPPPVPVPPAVGEGAADVMEADAAAAGPSAGVDVDMDVGDVAAGSQRAGAAEARGDAPAAVAKPSPRSGEASRFSRIPAAAAEAGSAFAPQRPMLTLLPPQSCLQQTWLQGMPLQRMPFKWKLLQGMRLQDVPMELVRARTAAPRSGAFAAARDAAAVPPGDPQGRERSPAGAASLLGRGSGDCTTHETMGRPHRRGGGRRGGHDIAHATESCARASVRLMPKAVASNRSAQAPRQLPKRTDRTITNELEPGTVAEPAWMPDGVAADITGGDDDSDSAGKRLRHQVQVWRPLLWQAAGGEPAAQAAWRMPMAPAPIPCFDAGLGADEPAQQSRRRPPDLVRLLCLSRRLRLAVKQSDRASTSNASRSSASAKPVPAAALAQPAAAEAARLLWLTR
ncbi:hypothetical protein PLESTM_001897100 [Pleodorina starrii]|nr:hypothetical protein PLESTM_001897100 [Pleodorina starrii]